MHAQPGDSSAEAWPADITAERSADNRVPSLHARDAGPFVENLILEVVDLADELACHSPGLNLQFPTRRGAHQSDAGAGGARNRVRGKLSHIGEQLVDPALAEHNASQSVKTGLQITFVGFPLFAGQLGFVRHFPPGLDFIFSHAFPSTRQKT